MGPGVLALEVEEYGSRPRPAAGPPPPAGAGVPVRLLVALTVFLAAFMTVAVILSQAAGAC